MSTPLPDPALLSTLERIATALEAWLAAQAPATPPDHVRNITDFATFDWSTIGAYVIESDQYGPSLVEHKGKTYKRRSPENKYDPAIWFSRAAGKDEDGSNLYERLITFKEFKPAEPLSRGAEAKAGAPKPAPAPAVQQPAPAAPLKPNGNPPLAPKPATPQRPPWAAPDDFDDEWEHLQPAAQQPAQARALAQAAASRPAPAKQGLPFDSQYTAIKWAVTFPHYQKDGKPDLPHAAGSHAKLCKQLNCSDKALDCWGKAWHDHVTSKPAF